MCACVCVCACVYICECKFIRIMYTPQSGYVYDTRYLQNGFGVQILMYPTNSTNSLLAGCSDWYCFYYYIKNSSKALLQVLFARGRPTTLDYAGCTWRQWLCQVATELRLQVPFFLAKIHAFIWLLGNLPLLSKLAKWYACFCDCESRFVSSLYLQKRGLEKRSWPLQTNLSGFIVLSPIKCRLPITVGEDIYGNPHD